MQVDIVFLSQAVSIWMRLCGILMCIENAVLIRLYGIIVWSEYESYRA